MKRLLSMGAMAFFAIWAGCVWAQQIDLIYPAEGEEITVEDLVDKGLQWSGATGATEFKIYWQADVFVQLQGPFTATSSPYKFPAFSKTSILPGNYTWHVEVTGGTGIGTSSAALHFTVVSVGEGLIPTPTPANPAPTPTPSGNLDGSGQISGKDTLFFASKWGTYNDAKRYGYDLNYDGWVNQLDLLTLMSRNGQIVPTPTPTPPAGLVQNIRLIPGAQVGRAETVGFEIQWDPPSYPSGDAFTYDVYVETNTIQKIEFRGLTATSIKPFMNYPNGWTQTGAQTAYIRAKDSLGRPGPIAVVPFEVVFGNTQTPTPTPLPVVDENLPAPVWNQADVPTMMLATSPFTYCYESARETVTLEPDSPVLNYDGTSNLCAYSQVVGGVYVDDQGEPDFSKLSTGTIFEFLPVDGASSYKVQLRYIRNGSDPKVIKSAVINFKTATSFTTSLSRDPGETIYLFEVQGVMPDGRLTPFSVPLQLTLKI
ncbi:MAG: hypothetical protein GC154_00445 [bacterium]|nr:hypothetical protein [bacterium]